ncbi:pol II transcription elongation factor-like protein subunit Cdc73 [Lophium mytilinum]|uniref:Pol II transcription elongation factor-like protein subunit Cdc73 n=1 Tax=Lophium mytilinum TaxID=390894 RepID=A0A6A6QCV0_9PEZI|nr:pol II transcription elongation factor-like protein subunit Cdc73 [Lophium mytilinum]
MATTAQLEDPLLNLRAAIASNTLPILTTTADPTSANDAVDNIAVATHLSFNHDDTHRTFPLSTPTRFAPSGTPFDLRSIYFAWLQREEPIQTYIIATQALNQELSAPGGPGGSVQNLVFAHRLELVSWLKGEAESSEYIQGLDLDAATAQAAASAEVASGATGGIATVPSATAPGKVGKTLDQRLAEIYEGERKMGDRNSVLRGIKPTDFSHIRKIAATYLKHGRPTAAPASIPQPLVSNLKKPARRIEPIILLSPSASSLLRMSNIKSFLDNGIYIPANDPSVSSNTLNLLHLTRLLPSVDPAHRLRFVLVDTPDMFKPDYWSRVVAVFTTGQTWQFKSYKWTQPAELFSHALGIHVGWNGEETPDVVKGWGRGVRCVGVDKWSPAQGAKDRWRDRQVVEEIWGAIEESMRAKGWGKDGPSAR